MDTIGDIGNARAWTRCVTTTLSCRIDAVNELQISVVMESLRHPCGLPEYAEKCLHEMQQSLENFHCIESVDYRMDSGAVGVQSLCRWMPQDRETYIQLYCFAFAQAQACRLFVSFNEEQWRNYGELLRRNLRTLEFWKL